MVSLANAYTAPINPPGANPVLKRSTVFAGLRRKVRHASEFVPVITSCEVLNVDGNVVTRAVQFKEGAGPPGVIKEVCVEHDPTKVDFKQPDGTTISNIISDGANGELYLTYSFEWKHPELEDGDAKIEGLNVQHAKTAKMAVDKTIEAIRRLVEAGELNEE